MKFRIVQLHNGKYRIQCKDGFFEHWDFINGLIYETYQQADDVMHDEVQKLRHRKNAVKGNEVCKVVEVEHV